MLPTRCTKFTQRFPTEGERKQSLLYRSNNEILILIRGKKFLYLDAFVGNFVKNESSKQILRYLVIRKPYRIIIPRIAEEEYAV